LNIQFSGCFCLLVLFSNRLYFIWPMALMYQNNFYHDRNPYGVPW
jgi:hypothetical protein